MPGTVIRPGMVSWASSRTLTEEEVDEAFECLADEPESALDRPLVFSEFTDKFAQTKPEHVASLRDLADRVQRRTAPSKAQLPWLKLARFGERRSSRGSLRHDANMLSIDGVEADYDAGVMRTDEAATLLRNADLAALIYTSPSHTPDKPRWRVLCPTSRPLPPAERGQLCARVNGVLRGVLAGESFTLSQSYYYGSVDQNPAHHVELVPGRFLDQAADLDAGAVGKPSLAKPNKPGTTAPAGTAAAGERARLNEVDLGEAITSGASYHEASTSLLGLWARRGVPLMEARARLERLFDAVSDTQRDVRWRDRRGDLDRILAGIYGKESAKRDQAAEALEGAALTEDGIALAFAAQYGDRLRYCHDEGKWYLWDGAIWRREGTRRAFDWARAVCREMAKKGLEQSKTLGKAVTAAAVERFAQADRAFAVTTETWDRDPMLLGTPGGTVNLDGGHLQDARRTDYITKAAAVTPISDGEFDPFLDCAIWLRYLEDTTGGDPGLIRFLQQWFGYCLTGRTSEHALLFIYGPGGNGKSVLINTLANILGDYATNAAMDILMASRFEKHSTDLAMLRGARMVMASETEEGRSWAEARIKAMTGGDRITARFMRQDNVQYTPQFKLTLVGNHKPVLHNVDDAMKRRFNIVSFERKPERPDPDLEAKLREEWPGILAWAIRGCVDWQANGLVRPGVVLQATAEYFAAQDTFQQWQEECSEARPALQQVGRGRSEASV
jgi:P4 family phage/plasmid primase-like protien